MEDPLPAPALITQLWEPIVVGLVLVGVAALLNLLAPARRRGLRTALGLYGLYLAAWALRGALTLFGVTEGIEWVGVTSDLLLAFTLVDLTALLLFDLAIPRLGIKIPSLVGDLAMGLAYFIVGAIVLSAAGIDPTSVVAASTIVAAVLTVSLQGTLGNVIGGFVLQLDGSIHAGDCIRMSDGKEGFVRTVRWRHTLVETRDGDTIVMPNALLLQSWFMIIGKREDAPLQHRSWSYFQVDYSFSPTLVTRVVEEALRAAPIQGVSMNPPPDCVCVDLASQGRDAYALYAARHWLTDLGPDDPIGSRVRMRIHAALQRAGIPFAQLSLSVFHTARGDDHLVQDLESRRRRGLAALGRLDLFKTLTEREQAQVAAHLVPTPFIGGEIMARQGDVAHSLYVLAEGNAEVRVVAEGRDRVVAQLQAPTFFGEMGLLTGEPRSATVIAVSDCECYQLDRPGFEGILKDRPDIAAELSALLASRRVGLRAAQEGLDDASRKAAEAHLRAQLVYRIRSFFGLDEEA